MIAGFPQLTAAEAAALISNDDTIGFGGFTPAGSPKAVSREIAQRAIEEHEAGRRFSIGVITGASTGPSLDGVLATSDAVKFRTPYQSDPELRKRINTGKTRFFDMHLSQLPQAVRYGFLGKLDWAIVEVCDIKPTGEVVLTSSVGASPTFLHQAKRVVLELNKRHPAALRGFHDLYEPEDPPARAHIPIYHASDRIGTETVMIDPAKIAGVVETDLDDEVGGFTEPNEVTRKIGENVADFLAGELRAGRITPDFLPIQSGVGNIANAVLFAMGRHPDIPAFSMYTEVIQESVKGGKVSPIVPMVSHLDHSEHSVQIIVTEHGVADLRGKSPHERAELIIEKCADPVYRPLLRAYLALGGEAHTPQSFDNAYALHRAFLAEGDMRKAVIADA